MSCKKCENLTDIILSEKAFILKRKMPSNKNLDYLLCDESGLAWMLRIKGKSITNIYKLNENEGRLTLTEISSTELKDYKKKYHF